MFLEKRDKKGISPVVATVLLITISLILISIIFIWAKSTVTDVKTKFGEDVKGICGDISLDISIVNKQIDVVNTGSRVSVSGVALRTSEGDLEECIFEAVLSPGKAVNYNAELCGDGTTESDVEAIIPIVTTDEGDHYNCDKNEILDF